MNSIASNSPYDGAPIIRVVSTILVYAIKDEAREIWIEVPIEAQSFRVFYLLKADQALKEQMKIPGWLWAPIEARLMEMAADDNVINVTFQGMAYRIELSRESKLEDEIGLNGEALVLKLKRKDSVD